jgi:DNA-directed RNA polymerase specialized sigma24 family protein
MRNTHPIQWSDWQKVVERSAYRYLKRAHAAGARSVQLADVVSELSLAWVIARDNFDPSLGVPFGAYLQLGMRNHINPWINRQIRHAAALDLDEDHGEEDGAGLHEVIADGSPLQDDVLGDAQEFERTLSQLSPQARQFVELLANPPPALYEEMTAIQTRATFANARGIRTGVPSHITGALVLDLMGADRVERNRIYGEVKGLARQILR